ncbi:SRPBCC family protein [Actinacidiphila alni]|uniref:SRPBCC family protein n=1 Tax=Actinacidiphila alni TaxID=380248 RepID=UPI0034541F43
MTEMAPRSTRIIGQLRAEAGRGIVRMEDVYDTDAADLWSALTRPERLARWIAEVDGDLVPGGEFAILFTSGWEGPGRVEVCEEPRRLVVITGRKPDETTIEALLTPEGARTRLVVEERGLPLTELAAHGAGWQAHVEDLTAHLAGQERGDWHARWKQLDPVYREIDARRG